MKKKCFDFAKEFFPRCFRFGPRFRVSCAVGRFRECCEVVSFVRGRKIGVLVSSGGGVAQVSILLLCVEICPVPSELLKFRILCGHGEGRKWPHTKVCRKSLMGKGSSSS